MRSALIDASRPILARVVRDCQPALVVVAGVDGFALMTETLASELRVIRSVSRGGNPGTYQWCAYDAVLNSHPLVIAQVPHFSRANSMSKLEECTRWLVGLTTPMA
jgi:hypothetical protein